MVLFRTIFRKRESVACVGNTDLFFTTSLKSVRNAPVYPSMSWKRGLIELRLP